MEYAGSKYILITNRVEAEKETTELHSRIVTRYILYMYNVENFKQPI